jgi:hypothetical protein
VQHIEDGLLAAEQRVKPWWLVSLIYPSPMSRELLADSYGVMVDAVIIEYSCQEIERMKLGTLLLVPWHAVVRQRVRAVEEAGWWVDGANTACIGQGHSAALFFGCATGFAVTVHCIDGEST